MPATPTGDASLHHAVLLEANRLISVREGAQHSELPLKQAIIKAQANVALKGNAHAQRYALDRIDRAEKIQAAAIARAIEAWEDYVVRTRQKIADAKARGEPEPLILPHPDDVVIDRIKGVRFSGPLDEQQLAYYEGAQKQRDQYFLQNELDERYWPTPAAPYSDDGPGYAMIQAVKLNALLPKRMRLSEGEINLRIYRIRLISKRELLKRVYRGWVDLGKRRVRRGQLSAPMKHAIARFDAFSQLLDAAASGNLDLSDINNPEFQAHVTRINDALRRGERHVARAK